MLSVEGGPKTLEQDLTLGLGHKDTVAYSSRVSARSGSGNQKAPSANKSDKGSSKSSGFASLFKREPEKQSAIKTTKQLLETDLVNIIYVEPGKKAPSNVKEMLQ